MDEPTDVPPHPVPLGLIEPRIGLLQLPAEGAQLFKMMKVEHLLASVDGSYLHFNRVDSYSDFPGADAHDGAQLPRDRPTNDQSKFEQARHFSAADYYDQARARTYACCFSTENSGHIWREYANGSEHGKVCLVFDFGRLRARLNATLNPQTARLELNGVVCKQFLSVDYGLVRYVDWDRHRANEERLANPIEYTFLKATAFEREQELRIALSAIGIGRYVIGGKEIEFPTSIPAPFDFRQALNDGTVVRIELPADSDFLSQELERRGMGWQRTD